MKHVPTPGGGGAADGDSGSSRRKHPGAWTLSLALPPRLHRFLFRIDGKGYEFCSDIGQTQARLWPTGPQLQVNCVDVAPRRPGTTLACKVAKPRVPDPVSASGGDEDGEENVIDADDDSTWSAEESIFFSRYMSDASDLYLAGGLAKRIAHTDIERIHGNLRAPEKSGVGSFFEDDTDAMSVTTLLEQRMHILVDSFVFYSAMATPIEVCKKNAFHKFVVDAHIVSEATKKHVPAAAPGGATFVPLLENSADVDVIFAATAKHASDSLTRAEFCCAAMCRIIKKVLRTNQDCHTARHAGELVLDSIEKHAMRYSGDVFRSTQLYTETIDQILRKKSLELKTVWTMRCSRRVQSVDDGALGVALSDWVKCCVNAFQGDAGTLPFSVQDLKRFFAASTLNFAETAPRTMQFTDFLEGMCRLAKFLAASPLSMQEAVEARAGAKSASSSWSKIRELSSRHAIFLREKGVYLSIHSGKMVRSDIREKAHAGGQDGGQDSEQDGEAAGRDGVYYEKLREVIHKVCASGLEN